MGMLIDGKWHDVWYKTKEHGGHFKRKPTSYRGQISAKEGAQYPAESGRYHLYVSLACPWAHRTLIVRKLKGLDPHISVSVVHPDMQADGWTFAPGEGVVADPIAGVSKLHEVYTHNDPTYTGRVTVPILFDKKTNTIVNNESSEIIRMFDAEFGYANNDFSFYPEALRTEINAVNEWVYPQINNGVYKAGFATTQDAYNTSVDSLFEGLDRAESLLNERKYLAGEQLTEADIRLFTTLIRFDPVYHGHFKCNVRRLVDYDNLWALTREIYQIPGVAETTNFPHITRHYHYSHRSINPHGIVPRGPVLDYWAPHNR